MRVKEAAGEYPQTEQYLSLTKKSDQALEYLLDYFSQREDPVVVLFFGDHWPNLEEEYLTDLLGTDSTSLGLKDMMREYQVPFVIWANYPLESQEIERSASTTYPPAAAGSRAGGHGLHQVFRAAPAGVPVITAVGTMDKDGSLYAVVESTPYDSLLNDYAVLQYNNALGAAGRSPAFLPGDCRGKGTDGHETSGGAPGKRVGRPLHAENLHALYRHPGRAEASPRTCRTTCSALTGTTYGLGWLLCEIDYQTAGFCHLSEDPGDPEDLFSVEFRLYVKQGLLRRGVGTACGA